MLPEDIIENDHVDTASQYSSEDTLLMPSYSFGIKYLLGCEGDGCASSHCSRTLAEAFQSAQLWCESGKNRSAVVFRRKDGKVMKVFT